MKWYDKYNIKTVVSESKYELYAERPKEKINNPTFAFLIEGEVEIDKEFLEAIEKRFLYDMLRNRPWSYPNLTLEEGMTI